MLNKPRIKDTNKAETEADQREYKQPDNPALFDLAHQPVNRCLMIILLKVYGTPDDEDELKYVECHECEQA